MPCPLCDGKPGDLVFEDAKTFVVLHEDWSIRGHAMVVWRAHVENLSDLTADELHHLMRVHAAAERALLAATKTERAIVMKLGIATPHLHLHIYPFPSTGDRAAVFAAIDGKTRAPRDEGFIRDVTMRLDASLRNE